MTFQITLSNVVIENMQNRLTPGGAIYISQINSHVSIDDSIFSHSLCDKSANTLAGERNMCGGCLFIDAGDTRLIRIQISFTTGVDTGSTIFIGGQHANNQYVDCLCEYGSSTLSNQTSSPIFFSTANHEAKNINISETANPLSSSLAYKIGNHPYKVSLQYMNLKDSCKGLAVSTNGASAKLENIFIEDIFNSASFFQVFSTALTVTNLYVRNVTGNLFDNADSSTFSITNSRIGSLIYTGNLPDSVLREEADVGVFVQICPLKRHIHSNRQGKSIFAIILLINFL